MNQAYNNLLNRRSIRKYKAEPLTPAELDAVLEAGRFAPTAMNLQDTVMVATQDPALVKRLSALNAAVMGKDTDPFYGAPAVVAVFADGAKPNCVKDGSLVLGNLMNAASALGLGSCWINRAFEVFEGPEGKALMKEWGVPEGYIGVGNCILGYPDEAPAPKPRTGNRVIKV